MAKVICLNGKSYFVRTNFWNFSKSPKWQKLFCLNGKSYFVWTNFWNFTSPLNGKSYLLKWQKLFRSSLQASTALNKLAKHNYCNSAQNKLAKHNYCNSAQCRSAFGLLSSKLRRTLLHQHHCTKPTRCNRASPAPLNSELLWFEKMNFANVLGKPWQEFHRHIAAGRSLAPRHTAFPIHSFSSFPHMDPTHWYWVGLVWQAYDDPFVEASKTNNHGVQIDQTHLGSYPRFAATEGNARNVTAAGDICTQQLPPD